MNPIRPTDESAMGSYSDEQMQEELVEWLEGQEYWKRNKGRDHVIICQDPNALYKVIDRVRNAVLLVSDFGRLRGDQASLVKDVVLPYSHRINPYKGEVGVEGRPSLLFFMGNRYRKEVGFIHVCVVFLSYIWLIACNIDQNCAGFLYLIAMVKWLKFKGIQ